MAVAIDHYCDGPVGLPYLTGTDYEGGSHGHGHGGSHEINPKVVNQYFMFYTKACIHGDIFF